MPHEFSFSQPVFLGEGIDFLREEHFGGRCLGYYAYRSVIAAKRVFVRILGGFKRLKAKQYSSPEQVISQLRSVTCHMGITQCYLPPDMSEHTPPLPQPDWHNLLTPQGWKAELSYVGGYILTWFTRPQLVTRQCRAELTTCGSQVRRPNYCTTKPKKKKFGGGQLSQPPVSTSYAVLLFGCCSWSVSMMTMTLVMMSGGCCQCRSQCWLRSSSQPVRLHRSLPLTTT